MRKRLTLLLAVAAMWAAQAVPAIGEGDTGSEDYPESAVAQASRQFVSSVPGIYPVGELVTGQSGLRGAVIDPATGFLWTSDRDGNKINVFDHTGVNRLSFGVAGNGSGQFDAPQGIAFLGDEVFIAEENNDRVQVFDKQGTYLRNWGTTGAGIGEFNEPCGVEIVNNLVYVADANNHRIQVFTPAGNYVNQFGSLGTGDGQLDLNCSGAGLTHFGNELFVTDERNDRVVAFNLNGGWERNIGAGSILTPEAIDADDKGQLWVAEFSQDRISVWTTIGAPLGTFGSSGTTVGALDGPRGVVVDPSGEAVWVLEQNTARIQAFTTLKCEGNVLTHVGTSYNDTLVTAGGNDIINLGAGRDTASTRGGDDMVCAGSGSDTVNGGAGDDRIFGIKGNDKLRGAGGDDFIVGGRGDDKLFGGKGIDVIDGYLGDDLIWGGPKGDTLKGNLGNDTLRGESGNDVLKGGKDIDRCFGGTGGNDQAFACETTGGIP